MKNTKDGYKIYAVVFDIGDFIVLKYRVDVNYFILEIPKTKMNDHLKIGDEVIMSLYIKKETIG